MCVIAVKPSNIDIPPQEKLKQMWERNSDGAGYMYADEGAVFISKGYMEFDDFTRSLDDLKVKMEAKNKTLKDIPMVLHFRITTHGGTSRENTHPFPISNNEEHLKALDLKCNIGMAHNGIISGLTTEKDVSDTQIYIRDIVYDLSVVGDGFVERFSKIIDYTKGSSRLAFLDKDGELTMFGNFVELDDKDGLYYSNKLFLPTPVVKNTTYNYYRDVKPLITQLVAGVDYVVRKDIVVPPYIENHYGGKTLTAMADELTNYGYGQFNVDGSKTISYVDVDYLDLKRTNEVLITNTKNNIGGSKNTYTTKILQNANRTLYDKKEFKVVKFKRVNKNAMLIGEPQKTLLHFGDYVFLEDLIVDDTDHNFYFNLDDRSYYYRQKDGAFMQIDKKYVCAEALLDDYLEYVGYSEMPISSVTTEESDVILYQIK